VLVLGALALFCEVHEVRAASTHARFGDADRLTPIFRDGFSTSGFHDFYRGMANASNWFSIDSMEMLLGLASALVALLALLFLSTERRKGTNEPAAAPAAPTQRPQPKDPIEQRRVRRAEARARRNARAAAETSSRLGS
jgi:hypothetical protein